MTINAFHPDYVKTYMPNFMTTIRTEQKQTENGKLYGAKNRQRENDLTTPNYNTINRFPKTKAAR
jgi:hypothetical protein